MKYPRDLEFRSYRVVDAFAEMRLARRLGRRVNDQEAHALRAQMPDPLARRALWARLGVRLVARDGSLVPELLKKQGAR